ncbi:trypsin-like peptidase domain-containing protein [Pseudomonas syringae group genomosp. 3]|uniref:trypsin-like peptidase domain-containing protein n=1 Tax=Pseudomonas syringae group genomosp. 3 TaxID=251701 RepID=UPI001604EB3D|nr:trypsin-like peptidase domain-containing protein [Pseudomonas syringae group genomosp. 3]
MLTKKYFVLSIFLVLAGCSTFHEPKPVNLPQIIEEARYGYERPALSLTEHQVVISTGKYWGMGVVLSPTRIATAAHVVSDVSVGDVVTIKYALGVREPFTRLKGVLKFVDAAHEVAILELLTDQLPARAPPVFCSHSVGGNKLASLAPVTNGNTMMPYTGLAGYTTNITTFPRVSDAFNDKARLSGFPPNEAVGQERVTSVITSSTQHGNSGGALFDVDQQCVVGIISIVVPIRDLESPGLITDGLNEPGSSFEDRDLLFAVPITEFLKFE